MHLLLQILMVALMVFGFGFVVFFHELGHFLAAKWVGIRVEQFAVGFGQALFAWRKGIGWKVGTTNKEVRRRCETLLATRKAEGGSVHGESAEYTDDQINKASDELGIGETEYRLNWIPLGGYVKMLGQDDLKANAGQDDPRAYNRKGIPQRMLVVSAGVIMNIILAAIGFMAVFVIGFDAPPPVVGHVITGSPAQRAGLRVGDRILTIDGTRQYDFNRIVLSAALLKANAEVPVEIERPDPKDPGGPTQKVTLRIKPAEMDGEIKVLGLGIGQSQQLSTAPGAEADDSRDLGHLPDFDVLKPGETIVEINGKPVSLKQYYVLFDALQTSGGKPVPVTVESADHSRRAVSIRPWLDQIIWGNKPVTIAGMEPRPMIDMVLNGSSAAGKLEAGDVITGIQFVDQSNYVGREQATKLFGLAADAKQKVNVSVVRDGKDLPPITDIVPKMRLEGKKRGMGLALGYENKPVTSQVLPDSPAGRAKVPAGLSITEIDGKPVENWFQVRDALSAAGKHELSGLPPGESKATAFALEITPADADAIKAIQAQQYTSLQELKEPRKTHNPMEAASWGLVETRDFVLQFYVTLQRMFQGSVPVNSMMGPLGIVTSGARFAFKGAAWLIWFLSMISANLAVVNFLPIPIVDGGLFTFLLLEKIQGKPLSPKIQAVFQIVGFALIISVFLLVTFQDIRRNDRLLIRCRGPWF